MVPQSYEPWAKNELVYHLDEIDGHEFESAAVEVFRRIGYRTERGKLSNDHGRDIILRKGNEVIVVECKHQRSGVGRPVVQKLHSATLTYPDATRGLILTTGWFAPSAHQYANTLNERPGVGVDLWDYEKLVGQARAVGIYFVGSLHGTNVFFWVPWRDDADANVLLKGKHLDSLRSAPRPIGTAFQKVEIRRQLVPSLIADSKVDTRFETQVGCIYRASHLGRRIYNIDGNTLSPPEQHFWAQSTPALLANAEVDGKGVATYFGRATGPLTERLRTEIAQQLSRRVKYSGRNNQQYEKFCEVSCDDVCIQSKQVLLARWSMEFEAGPRKYIAWFADEMARQPCIVSSGGFDHGVEGFVCGNGFLCNDCGLITPGDGNNAGAACECCSRTLCRAHIWIWPALLFRHSNRLCASCYESRQRTSPQYNVNSVLRNYSSSMLVSAIPGVQLLLGKKYAVGAALVLLFLCTLLATRYGYNEPAALLVGASIIWSIHWTSRIRAHNRNLKRLSQYKPDWGEAA
jgi:restriction system protein